MELGVLFFVIADVKEYLVSQGLLANDGKFGDFKLVQDLDIVRVVENSLKAHGITIQSEIDKVINALPLVLALVTK